MKMQPRKAGLGLLLVFGCVFADNTPPDITLLELLGQWQELSELGVDIDHFLEDAPLPETHQPVHDQEASNT